MGIKMSETNSPLVCDGYVRYDKAEIDRLASGRSNQRVDDMGIKITPKKLANGM